MITEKFNEWLADNDCLNNEVDEDMFTLFLKDKYGHLKGHQMISTLAYAIHKLEVCVEGLIEDMEC